MYFFQYREFNTQYKPEKPKNPAVKSSPLYKAMAERQENYYFNKAVFAYWFLFSAAEEYKRINQTKSQVGTNACYFFNFVLISFCYLHKPQVSINCSLTIIIVRPRVFFK